LPVIFGLTCPHPDAPANAHQQVKKHLFALFCQALPFGGLEPSISQYLSNQAKERTEQNIHTQKICASEFV